MWWLVSLAWANPDPTVLPRAEDAPEALQSDAPCEAQELREGVPAQLNCDGLVLPLAEAWRLKEAEVRHGEVVVGLNDETRARLRAEWEVQALKRTLAVSGVSFAAGATVAVVLAFALAPAAQ